MLRHRTVLKWTPRLGFGLILYFFLVEPEENRADPGGALSTHAGMEVLLALIVALWLGVYLRKGLAVRPGPKLPGWAKRFHGLNHKVLQRGVPAVVATGAFAGLAAPFVIRAFGLVQINPAAVPMGLHKLAQEVHEIAFDALIVLVVLHALFHLWRQFLLKDNALRIMLPKVLHKHI